MYYLLLENYNNYENRIIKKFDTVQEYINDATAKSHNYVHYTTRDVNFNKGDNITATHIFNDNISPDYLLWIDKTTGNIVSRWFVINYQHTSGNQFLATLKHDSIADNLSSVLTSPAFIHKGYVGNSDPAVFNKENMGFNQIKTKEGYIQDITRCAYIVGYLATDHSNLTDENFTYNAVGDVEFNVAFNDWNLSYLCDGTPKTTIDSSNLGNEVRFILRSNILYEEFVYNVGSSFVRGTLASDYWRIYGDNIREIVEDNWFDKFGLSWNDTITNIFTDNPSLISLLDYDEIKGYEGKLIKFTDGFYKITVIQDTSVQQDDWSYYDSGHLYNYIYNKVNTGLINHYDSYILDSNRYPVAYKLYERRFIIKAEKVSNVPGTYHYTMNSSSEKNLKDAPYKMFVIPYRTVETAEYTFNNKEINNELALQWAMDIAKKLGTGIYDLQLLPYFPDSESKIATTIDYIIIDFKHYIKGIHIDYDETLVEGSNVVYLKDSTDNIVNYAFFFERSTFKASASAYQLDNYPIVLSIPDYKISNECDLVRICSPNYASAFEFSPAKNGGRYSGYKVYCTYKPYNPFVYVSPNFTSLYGGNYKDNRGLILSGDFSLPIVNDSWINYQLNNKNYLLAFDRQIQNMEFNYTWQRREAVANAISGVTQGTTMGALTGASVGGPYGAVAGAIVGAGASTVGGILDLTRQRESFSESKDYAYDSFGYQLGNIKALPNTLNKVSSLVATSKLYPVFEYYTCTDEEKQALRDKIKYNGMSIGRIGTISQFLNPEGMTYIKCQLIRNTSISCSANQLLDIYNELEKGVFIE